MSRGDGAGGATAGGAVAGGAVAERPARPADPPSAFGRPDLPYRQLSRLGDEYALSQTMNLLRLIPSFDRGVILLLVIRQCLPDWTEGGVIRPPRCPTRFVSVNGLAASLARPFETVRRHVHALVAGGYCSFSDRGIALAGSPERQRAVQAYLAGAHDLLLRLAQDIAATGMIPGPARVAGQSPVPAIVATALDVSLMPIENFRGRVGDWTSMLIWLGIAVANVRHVTHDPVLSARYAYRSTPDELRAPASLRAVGRLFGLSPTTVWRHRRRLEQAGVLERRGDGWIIATAQLLNPGIEQAVTGGVHSMLRRLCGLVALGMDPAAPPYLAGRPDYVPFRE